MGHLEITSPFPLLLKPPVLIEGLNPGIALVSCMHGIGLETNESPWYLSRGTLPRVIRDSQSNNH